MNQEFLKIQEELRDLVDIPKDVSEAPPLQHINELLDRGKAIYGPDNRVEPSETDKAIPEEVCSAVCVLVHKDRVDFESDYFKLKTKTFGETYKLCKGQAFQEQPLLGFGSGFLVLPNVIVTTGHCIKDKEINKIYAIFDYEWNNGKALDRRKASDIYTLKELVNPDAKAYETHGKDYAVVKLHRKVKGVKPLTIVNDDVKEEDDVYCVGHPVGLPKKVATGATVGKVDGSCFSANLDTFAGNSGSPVFTKTHEVAGILVRGAPDFIWKGDCRVATSFPLTQSGESACKAGIWKKHITTDKFSGVQDVPAPELPKTTIPTPEPRHRKITSIVIALLILGGLAAILAVKWPSIFGVEQQSVDVADLAIDVGPSGSVASTGDATEGYEFNLNRRGRVLGLGFWDEGSNGTMEHSVAIWSVSGVEKCIEKFKADDSGVFFGASSSDKGRWVLKKLATPVHLDQGTYIIAWNRAQDHRRSSIGTTRTSSVSLNSGIMQLGEQFGFPRNSTYTGQPIFGPTFLFEQGEEPPVPPLPSEQTLIDKGAEFIIKVEQPSGTIRGAIAGNDIDFFLRVDARVENRNEAFLNVRLDLKELENRNPDKVVRTAQHTSREFSKALDRRWEWRVSRPSQPIGSQSQQFAGWVTQGTGEKRPLVNGQTGIIESSEATSFYDFKVKIRNEVIVEPVPGTYKP